MKKKIYDLIKSTEEIEESLFTNRTDFLKLLPEYISLLTNTIMEIIVSYTNNNLREYAEDAVYWSDLCKRIVSGLNGRDQVQLIDLLHFELIQSLRMYEELI